MIPNAAAAVTITPAGHALIADLVGRNTYGGTTMAEHNPDAEGSDGPQAQPEPPEQTRHAAGTGSQAAKRRHDRPRPQRGQIRPHPVVLEQQAKRASDLQLRIADWITAFAGSMRFVYIHITVFTIWMVFIESKPWPTLTLIVSLEAIFLSTFVLIGQNRQSEFQQAKADHDFNEQEMELKTNTELTREIDRLTIELHSRLLDKPAR